MIAIAAPCTTASAEAHEFTITRVVATIRADDTFVIDMRVDVDALALGVSPSVPSEQIAAALQAMTPEDFDAAVENATRTLRRRASVRCDDERVDVHIEFPERDMPPPTTDPVEASVLGTIARLTGRIPTGAETFSFRASRSFNTVELTILDEVTASGARFTLVAGQRSPPYRIHELRAEERAVVLVRYAVLGFEHILPKGLDHILFVLGLFLLSARIRPLLWQVTAFTVAHSVTLALSMTGVASLPGSIVEPLIALSIAYVAIENLFVQELKPWRPAVVFVFGLLHGMGFAGVLRELGMPGERFVTALIGFNVGVEAGQLAVVALAFLTIGWFRNRPWYRRFIVLPASACIAITGAYWAVQRTFLGG